MISNQEAQECYTRIKKYLKEHPEVWDSLFKDLVNYDEIELGDKNTFRFQYTEKMK